MKTKKISDISWLLIFSVLTLFIAPILDGWIDDNIFTPLTTFIFASWIVYKLYKFIGSWRDEEGKWTKERAKSKIIMYKDILWDYIKDIRISDRESRKVILIIFFGSVGLLLKALPNATAIIRVVPEWIGFKMTLLRDFEKFANEYYWLFLFVAFLILVLPLPTKQFLIRVVNEVLNILQIKLNISEPQHISSTKSNFNFPIINSNDKKEIDKIIKSFDNQPISDLLKVISSWRPEPDYYEWYYNDKLFARIRKLKQYKASQEYKFENRRFDIVFNEDVVLELKRSIKLNETDRTKTQLREYLKLWEDKGCVILVLIDVDYEKAVEYFYDDIKELQKVNKPTFAIVVQTKYPKQLKTVY